MVLQAGDRCTVAGTSGLGHRAERRHSLGFHIAVKTLRVLVVTSLLDLVCAAPLAETNHLGRDRSCEGILCQKTSKASVSERVTDTELARLLASRISNIYRGSIRKAGASEGELEAADDRRGKPEPGLAWRKLMGQEEEDEEGLPRTGDELWGVHHADDEVKKMGQDDLSGEIQKLGRAEWDLESLADLWSLIPAGDFEDPFSEMTHGGERRDEEREGLRFKRQQGWHIQYGKRADDMDSIVDTKEAGGDDTSRAANTAAGHSISDTSITSVAGLAAGDGEYYPTSPRDFVELAKKLSGTQRKHLAHKLVGLLKRLNQAEQISDPSSLLQSRTVGGLQKVGQLDNTQRGTRGKADQNDDEIRSSHPQSGDSNVADNDEGESHDYRGDNDNDSGKVDVVPSSRVSNIKRQQGWYIQYGKRDVSGRWFSLHN